VRSTFAIQKTHSRRPLRCRSGKTFSVYGKKVDQSEKLKHHSLIKINVTSAFVAKVRQSAFFLSQLLWISHRNTPFVILKCCMCSELLMHNCETTKITCNIQYC
ncbi:hypothetical protein L9F63_023605, partial [Diploptera punctata]